jgi:5-methyltetrahydrofolate--homocysteine methyltransferase
MKDPSADPPPTDFSEIHQQLTRLSRAVLKREFQLTSDLTHRLIREKIDPFHILNHGLIPGMLEASERFRRGECYIPELLMSSRALKIGIGMLKPLIREMGRESVGKVVIGTVKFDLHDIGKNLVVMLLEGHGFEVVDLGVDIPPEKFVKAVQKYEPQILAMSSLLTSTLCWLRTTIERIHSSGISRQVRTIVGGGPVTSLYAKNIGADGYCREAISVPGLAKRLIGVE